MKDSFKIVAKTLFGLEPLLEREIKKMGGKNVKVVRRAVSFDGDKTLLYKANYTLRTAIRVLCPIYEFSFADVDDFYDKLYNFSWKSYMSASNSFAIDNVVYSSKFRNSLFAVYRFKDAICDYFVRHGNKRPSVNTMMPEVQFNLHVSEDKCTISLDSSGKSLHKRGYRYNEGLAPINETLAAAIVQMTGWDGKQTLIDPMCGSGTLLIEAIMYAKKIPAGYFRDEFGFFQWDSFDKTLWEKIKKEEDAKILTELPANVIGCDIDREVIRAIRVNLRRTKLHMDIKTIHTAFEDFENTFEEGMIISNPPYGERLGKGEVKEIFNAIGTKLKHDFEGFQAWLIAPKENFKHIGLRSSKKVDLFNGQIESQLQCFDLYKGSKKKEA